MARGDLPSTADVVVVGAGSAGCVVAERLSRNPDRSVLLLERGPVQWPSDADRELSSLPISPGAAHAVTIPEAAGLGVIRGRGFGGSSSVNGGYFLRWHAEDFAGWPTGWELADIARWYGRLDAPGGTMSVSAFGDAELAEVSVRFERYWGERLPVRALDDPWPIVGVNRVRSNRVGTLRMTAAEAYLRDVLSREQLIVEPLADVDELVRNGRTVTGVRVGAHEITCGEVILCAGTLGTAAILLRSGLDAVIPDGQLTVREHREILVHYRSRLPYLAAPLLQTVVHAAGDLEIRCYNGDMADYIAGVPRVGPAIGVASMRPGGPGEVRLKGRGVLVDLGDGAGVDFGSGPDDVVEMLGSGAFADVVEPGSVTVDPVVRNSQHAWGSMQMGRATDWLGGVQGLRGLRIVDGSILPTAGRSGPHATTMMMAGRIGDVLASG